MTFWNNPGVFSSICLQKWLIYLMKQRNLSISKSKSHSSVQNINIFMHLRIVSYRERWYRKCEKECKERNPCFSYLWADDFFSFLFFFIYKIIHSEHIFGNFVIWLRALEFRRRKNQNTQLLLGGGVTWNTFVTWGFKVHSCSVWSFHKFSCKQNVLSR